MYDVISRRLPMILMPVLIAAALQGAPPAMARTAAHAAPGMPVRLVSTHPLKPGWARLPRIAVAAGHPALERINRALAAADAQDADDDCIIQRDVTTTFLGRRYLSLMVSTTSHCAGAVETDLDNEILGFDLKTGAAVSWATLLPPGFHGSEAEARLYHATLASTDPDDAKNCANFSFDALDVWPDAKDGGIAFQPAGGFPVVYGPCLLSAVVPLAAMRKLGMNKALLDDIAQASASPGR